MMRRSAAPLLALAIGSATLLAAADQTAVRAPAGAPAASTGTGSIAGVVVTDDPSPAPLRRAEVTVRSVGGAPVFPPALTDDEGRFEVSGLPAGRYLVAAFKGGYVRRAYGASRPNRPGTPISVSEGQRVTGVSLALVRGAVIEGTLLDESGLPAVGVGVSLLQRHQQGTGEVVLRPPADASAAGETDDRGSFRLFGLPPGEYVVAASPRLAEDVRAVTEADLRRVQQGRATARGAPPTGGRGSSSLPASPEEAVTVGYAPVYFPGTTNGTSASVVRLSAGEERSGVDFSLHLIRMSRVDGMVVVPAGVAPQSVQLFLLPESSVSGGVPFTRATIGGDGRFSFRSVSPGRYSVNARAGGTGMTVFRTADGSAGFGVSSDSFSSAGVAGGRAPGGEPAPVYWGSLELSVEGRDVRDLVIPLQPALTLPGRITAEAGTTLPADLSAIRVSLSPVSTGAPVQAPPAVTVDPSGEFRLSGIVPGRYRLTASVPVNGDVEPLNVLAATIAGRDALDVPFEVTAADSTLPAVIMLTNRTQSVTGRLQDAEGRAAPDYTILVFPDEPRFWTAGARRIRTARPATDGSFVITGLPAGAYRIAALTDIEPSDTNDATFLQAVREAAVAFTLAPGERKVQDFRIDQ